LEAFKSAKGILCQNIPRLFVVAMKQSLYGEILFWHKMQTAPESPGPFAKNR